MNINEQIYTKIDIIMLSDKISWLRPTWFTARASARRRLELRMALDLLVTFPSREK